MGNLSSVTCVPVATCGTPAVPVLAHPVQAGCPEGFTFALASSTGNAHEQVSDGSRTCHASVVVWNTERSSVARAGYRGWRTFHATCRNPCDQPRDANYGLAETDRSPAGRHGGSTSRLPLTAGISAASPRTTDRRSPADPSRDQVTPLRCLQLSSPARALSLIM